MTTKNKEVSLNEIFRCRGCGKDFLSSVLNLGNLAIVKFKDSPEEEDDYSQLNLVECQDCHLIQLLHTVPRERLYDNFHYLSGINQSMNDALLDIVKQVERFVNIKPGENVVDIGANDGTLLSYYRHYVRTVGFEPAKNILPSANAVWSGEDWIQDYFSADSYMKWNERNTKKGNAKIVTAIAMFYDLEQPRLFLKDVHRILADDGIFILQMNDLDAMCQNISIDNICHEHLTYFNMDTLIPILSQSGLYPINVQHNNVNGGSIRVICSKNPYDEDRCHFRRFRPMSEPISLKDMWIAFLNERKRLMRYITRELKRGRSVMGYGASTRGNTLLQLLELDHNHIQAIADRNPKKYDKFTAGGNIPIIPEEEMRRFQPDNLLVLPYYFESEFLEREKEYLKKGGKMIFPLPRFRIWTFDDRIGTVVHGLNQ